MLRNVDREQLLHLVESGRLPHVTIQVLRESAQRHAGRAVEYMVGSIHIEDPDPVEIALTGSAARVRDSKNRTTSEVPAPHWAEFINAVKRGDLENN